MAKEMISGMNYARENPAFDGETFHECNLSQETPGTVMLARNCRFIECNLVNCAIDPSNSAEECNLSQVDFSQVE